MKRRNKAGIVALSAVFMVGCLAGCGDGKSNGTDITFYVGIDNNSVAVYENLVDAYNNGQGVKDGVSVILRKQRAGYDADLSTILAGNPPDVLVMSDKYFKRNALDDGLYNMQTLLENDALTTRDENGGKLLDLADISPTVVDRFRINLTAKTAGGASDPLYGLPNGANATFLYYNKDVFDGQKINVISLDEGAIAGTGYKACGYAEYTTAPASGLTASANLEGETVYKVFNNRIPMNWAEVLRISKYLTKSYNSTSGSTYGFLSDWWFSYGWSVGGDCMSWDETAGQYKFTLGNQDTNYLVTDTVEVNGTTYRAGSILTHKDRSYVNWDVDDVTATYGDKLYALPSQYDAFAEYCALSQKTDQKVDDDKYGYAISPTYSVINSYASKTQFFTAKEVAILAEGYNVMNNLAKNSSGSNLIHWDVAPLWQYKVYEGAEDGGFRVIGKDGYEGNVKTVNGTQIKGRQCGSDENTGYVIAKKAKNPESAYKFLQWACGAEGQKIIAEGNFSVPNQISYYTSAAYTEGQGRLCANMKIIADAAYYEEIGDWSYVEDGQWVSNWANVLNGPVRNGEKTLKSFFSEVTETADKNLKKYEVRISGK